MLNARLRRTLGARGRTRATLTRGGAQAGSARGYRYDKTASDAISIAVAGVLPGAEAGHFFMALTGASAESGDMCAINGKNYRVSTVRDSGGL